MCPAISGCSAGNAGIGLEASVGRLSLVEDPQGLLQEILAFAEHYDGIDAVVQTGSRARHQRVDAFSDLDIELIGSGAPGLAGRDDWPAQIAPVLVTLHFTDVDPQADAWPSSLVVFAQGRKVDFTLAGPQRLRTLAADGLDSTYMRGYVVHYDPAEITRQLAPPQPRAPSWQAPTAAEFVDVQRGFWFEATQVPIYAARDEPWPAQARLATAREMVLMMLEWRAGTMSGGRVDTWYSGYHLDKWIDAQTKAEITELFPRYDTADIIASLRAAIDLFARTTAQTGAALSLPVLELRGAVEQHLLAVAG
jgi:aminoglycoside 6-adenylyltransferase